MIQDLFESVGIQTSTQEEGKRARPDCGFHSLRHAFVTQLERVGVSLSERQRLAGHATAAMTEHYTHEDGSAAVLAAILPMLTSIDDKATLRKLQKSIESRIKALGA